MVGTVNFTRYRRKNTGHDGKNRHEKGRLRYAPAHFRGNRRVVQADGIGHETEDQSGPKEGADRD
jgi:hypothetical protein